MVSVHAIKRAKAKGMGRGKTPGKMGMMKTGKHMMSVGNMMDRAKMKQDGNPPTRKV